MTQREGRFAPTNEVNACVDRSVASTRPRAVEWPNAGFVDLAEYIPGLAVEARYATCHNLTGHPLAGYRAQKALARVEAAQALRCAFALAQQLGYGMLVYDAYRPQKAVDDFVRWSEAAEDGVTRQEFYPALEKTQLFPLGYIARRSGHSRGATIDLTLTKDGVPVDMGGGFDLMDERSHHNAPGLTCEQEENRRRLCAIMAYAGFAPYECEWWHYRLMKEPCPDTYFDFDIE